LDGVIPTRWLQLLQRPLTHYAFGPARTWLGGLRDLRKDHRREGTAGCPLAKSSDEHIAALNS